MTGPVAPGSTVVVLGLGRYGQSVGGALARRGYSVIAIEDAPTEGIR